MHNKWQQGAEQSDLQMRKLNNAQWTRILLFWPELWVVLWVTGGRYGSHGSSAGLVVHNRISCNKARN